MAGVYSKAEKEKIDLQMTCCLGNHPLQNPKLLPCQHSICTGCLKTKVNEDRKKFTCPKCQLSIHLTEKDVDQLPVDILYQIMQETNGNHDCVICKFDDKKTRGSFQCLDCADVLCDECKVGHTKTSQTRSHRLIRVKDIKGGKYKDELEAATKPICHTHSKPKREMALEYYCQECNCLVCQLCVYAEHQPNGHTCKFIDEIHDEKTAAIKDQVTKLFDLKQLYKVFATILEQSQKENKELQEKLENEVHKRASLIIDIVERVKEDTLTEIRHHFKIEDKHFERTLNETKYRTIRTDSLMSYTQAFLKHSAKSEFLEHESEMMNKLTSHMQLKHEKNIRRYMFEISEAQIEETERFITDKMGKIRIIHKILGSTVEDTNLTKEWLKEPEVLFSENAGIGQAWDLTVTEKGEIVTVHGSTIQVYNSDGKPKERISCRQLKHAWNVVAKSDTLYVSNRETNGTVLVMDFKGNVKKTINLPETDQGHYNTGLAVDDEDSVYMSSNGTNAIFKCENNETKAKVFIPQGSHPDLKGPWYLDLTSSGDLVVSNDGSKNVQVYGRHGEFLWQYKGQGDMKLNNPHGVCCDRDDNIYISDRLNHRVQVIKNGEFQRCVKMKELTFPQGIDLDKDGNIVCGFNYGHKITKIKEWK